MPLTTVRLRSCSRQSGIGFTFWALPCCRSESSVCISNIMVFRRRTALDHPWNTVFFHPSRIPTRRALGRGRSNAGPLRLSNQMRFAVLRVFRRNRPNGIFEINLCPSHSRGLLASLPCQREHLDNRAERKPISARGENDQPKLIVGQHANQPSAVGRLAPSPRCPANPMRRRTHGLPRHSL
jgi:hypothetical protein